MVAFRGHFEIEIETEIYVDVDVVCAARTLTLILSQCVSYFRFFSMRVSKKLSQKKRNFTAVITLKGLKEPRQPRIERNIDDDDWRQIKKKSL